MRNVINFGSPLKSVWGPPLLIEIVQFNLLQNRFFVTDALSTSAWDALFSIPSLLVHFKPPSDKGAYRWGKGLHH